jgi:hypothetical protein
VNRVAPSWLLCVLLVALLVVTSYRTLQKGIRVSKKETWNFFSRDALSQPSEASSLVNKPQAPASTVTPRVAIPWRKLATLFGLLVMIMVLNLLAGSATMPSIVGIRNGSWAYTVVSAMPAAFLLVFIYFSHNNIVAAYHRQQASDYIATDEEIKVRTLTLAPRTPHLILYSCVILYHSGPRNCSGRFRSCPHWPAWSLACLAWAAALSPVRSCSNWAWTPPRRRVSLRPLCSSRVCVRIDRLPSIRPLD